MNLPKALPAWLSKLALTPKSRRFNNLQEFKKRGALLLGRPGGRFQDGGDPRAIPAKQTKLADFAQDPANSREGHRGVMTKPKDVIHRLGGVISTLLVTQRTSHILVTNAERAFQSVREAACVARPPI